MVSRRSWTWGLLLAALLGASAQAEDPPTPEGVAFFEKRVRPLLVQHCYSCHSVQAKKVKGELLLDTRDGLRKGGASGPALVPGNPDASLLLKAVRHSDEIQMPPEKKLATSEIADLAAWVKMGAPDPRTGSTSATKVDLVKGREFWSFQPVRDHPAPCVKDTAWPRNTLDAFVLAGL